MSFRLVFKSYKKDLTLDDLWANKESDSCSIVTHIVENKMTSLSNKK